MRTQADRARRGWRWGWALALLMLLAVGWRLLAGRESPDEAGLTYTVTSGPLTISVIEAGTIKPEKLEILRSEIEGRARILYLVPEGTHVTNGQLLVELDASDLSDRLLEQEIVVQNTEAAALQQREALEVTRIQATGSVEKADLDLRFAREDLVQYQKGEHPNALKEQEARITLAQEELQRTEDKYRWSTVLFAEKYIAESELKSDELAVKKATLDLELARNSLQLLQDYTHKRRIVELEGKLKQAELTLLRETRKATSDVIQAESGLRAKDAELRRQTIRLEKLRLKISKARIVAPLDGLVIYATSTRTRGGANQAPLAEGQEVQERQELIHLPTASTFLAEVKIHESNLDKLKVDLPARITVDGLNARQFRGRVISIAPLPDAGSAYMNPDLKVYPTQIAITGGEGLRSGMSCRSEIVVERHAEVLAVPVQTVVRVEGRPTVYVRRDGEAVARTVEIGLDNNRMVHILSGLDAGERVLLAPPLSEAEVSEEPETAEPPESPAVAGPQEPVP